MNNAELFKKVFGIYAEEFWAYPKDECLIGLLMMPRTQMPEI